MPRKSRVVKTRAGGTMTESAYWGMIRSSLRNSSRWWKPISECKKAAKRVYKGTNKRQKYEYLCNDCKQYHSDKETVVDHINPVGTLTQSSDLPDFIENLFCEKEGLQLLCKTCHRKKTKADNEKTKQKRNKT